MPGDENGIWFTLLGNFGFPIAVSTYLLVKFEKKLDHLTTVVQELKAAMDHDE